VIAILTNSQKAPLFTIEERLAMVREVVNPKFPNVEIEVDVFHGLLVDYARRKNAQVIVRGIRAVTDYEYELQMALMNRRLAPGIETVFMMPAENYSYLSSHLVKEIAGHAGSITGLVPELGRETIEGQVQEPVMKLASRMSRIAVSGTMIVSEKTIQLREQGVDVIDFGAGEPDFPTPENIRQAGIRAIQSNFTAIHGDRRDEGSARRDCGSTCPRTGVPLRYFRMLL
jgi:pantetheine-phosphate adenylyltransferase